MGSLYLIGAEYLKSRHNKRYIGEFKNLKDIGRAVVAPTFNSSDQGSRGGRSLSPARAIWETLSLSQKKKKKGFKVILSYFITDLNEIAFYFLN